MKKIYSLIAALVLCVSAFAATRTTVLYAVPSDVVSTYAVKLNVNYVGNGDDWEAHDMTVTDSTYNGNPIYACTFNDKYNGLGAIQFQLYEGSTWKSEVQVFGTQQWTSPSVYNGKIYDHSTSAWIDYPRNLTFAAGTTLMVDARAYGSGMNLFLPHDSEKYPVDDNYWWSSTSEIILFKLAQDWTITPNSELYKSILTGWTSSMTAGVNMPASTAHTKLVISADNSSFSWEEPAGDYSVKKNDAVLNKQSFTIDKEEADANATVNVTVVPNDGFVVDSVTVVDVFDATQTVTATNLTATTFSFTMPSANVIVNAHINLEEAYLTGFDGNWAGDAYPMTKNGKVFTKTLLLANGSHSFKITTGSWSEKNWGYTELETTATGTTLSQADENLNIGMSLEAPSNVTITFTYNETGNSSLDVVAVPVTYSVTYNANGGEGEVTDATEYAYNASVAHAAGTGLSKSGYQFAGWADANGTAVSNPFNITMDTTLYAIWAQTYTVSYDANGGEGTVVDEDAYVEGATVTVKNGTALTKDGYAFAGWNTQADGMGTPYAAAATFVMGAANVVLYAQWTKVYTVYFYNNMGWTDVHVNLYTGLYWNETMGSGNNNAAVCNQPMTKIGDSDYYKYEFTGGPYSVVTFTSISQYDGTNNHGYENFYNCAAVYRVDFDATSDNLMFVSTAEWKETYNETGYYSDGVWMKYGADSYSFTVENDNFRTLCLPYAATLDNADAYEVFELSEGVVKVRSVENLVAATPYFIKPTVNTGTVTATYSGNPVSKLPNHAYMVGNLGATPMIVEANNHNYVLSNNALYKVVAGGTGVTIGQYKAFLYSSADLVPAQQGAPIRIVEAENNTTDIKSLEASEKAVKFFENGQLFILRDGVVYDATGRAVK